jgi:hypothetical protein
MILPKGVNAVKVDKLVAWRLALAALSESEAVNKAGKQPVIIRSAVISPRNASVASVSK